MKKALLTLDIIFILIVAVFAIIMNGYGYEKILSKYFLVFMLTAFYAGRYLSLYIAKKFLK
jgi:hypothetical protein